MTWRIFKFNPFVLTASLIELYPSQFFELQPLFFAKDLNFTKMLFTFEFVYVQYVLNFIVFFFMQQCKCKFIGLHVFLKTHYYDDEI